MPANFKQLDSAELDNLRLPYDTFAKKLQREPLLVAGSNVYASQNNTIRKRGGTGGDALLTNEEVTGRIDHLDFYETLENPSKVYLIASVYTGSAWAMYYLRLSATSPAWTSMGSVRDVNASTRPHEWVVAKGKVYIKGFPSSSGDKLGTVVFDGSGSSPTLTIWGLLGPTVPARIVSSGSWAASTDPVDVIVGWTYVYTWKTLTGHESNRSPLEFDPANNASSTGAFSDLCPQVTVQGHADTTNIPTIVIYRSGDGGGNYMRLAEITNTGAGNIVYEDDDLDGNNPIPTGDLDTADLAPSLTSNSPPPSVVPPGVVGTTQVAPCTRLAYWQGRIWYGIGSTLFFSGQEEIRNGVPEECFPSGILSGNKFLFQQEVTHATPTQDILYVKISRGVQAITGQFRDEFRPRGLSEVVGGAKEHPHAACAIEQQIYWLTHDFQIATGNAGSFNIISRPLGAELRTQRAIELAPYIAPGIAWLLVLAKTQNNDLNEPEFTTTEKWGSTTDVVLTSGAAVYTDGVSGAGAVFQNVQDMQTPLVAGVEYSFTYTVSGKSGDVTASIPTGVATTGTEVTLNAGRQTITFTAHANQPAAPDASGFEVDFLSTSGGVTLDDFHLRPTAASDEISTIYVYDLESQQWNPPWEGTSATAMAYGPISESDRFPKLLFGLWEGSNDPVSSTISVVGEYTDDTFTDFKPNDDPANIAFSLETNLFPIPVGNRNNQTTRGGVTANFAGWVLEWISGVTAPTVAYALDDASGSVTAATGVDVTIRDTSVGYVTKHYPAEEMAQRSKLKISRTADAEGFVLETITAMWQPLQGA